MLEKTMKSIIQRKVDEWISSIDDKDVIFCIKKDLIITGGCFASMIQDEKPKDFDCYFRTKESVVKVAQYYANKWNEEHEDQTNKLGIKTKVFVLDGENPSQEILNYFNVNNIEESEAILLNNCSSERVKMIYPSDGFVEDDNEIILESPIDIIEDLDEIDAEEIIKKEKKNYFPVFISSNAITLSKGIQVIVRFYGEPNEIHETYDFTHTKAYWDHYNQHLNISKEVYECVINKILCYTGSLYPICSIFRTRKFIKRGWKINAGQLLKMCFQISNLDLNNINTLEDQLIGVDTVYFQAVINNLKKAIEENSDFVLTSDYFITLIDKIF